MMVKFKLQPYSKKTRRVKAFETTTEPDSPAQGRGSSKSGQKAVALIFATRTHLYVRVSYPHAGKIHK